MSELENVKITMKQAVGPDSIVWYDVHNFESQRLESSPFSEDIIDQMANLAVKGWEGASPIKFIEEFGDIISYDKPILEVYKLIMEQAKAAKELPNLSEEMEEMLSSVKISRDDKTEGVYSGEVILETDVSLLIVLLESFKNERKLPHLYATKLHEDYLVKVVEDGSFVKMNREQLIYLRTFLDVWGVDAALSTLEEPEKVTIKFTKTNTSDTVYKNFAHLKTIK